MRLSRSALLSGVAVIALAAGVSAANAADMVGKARPVMTAAAPVPFSWTGWYIGGHLGLGSTGFASTISQPELGTRHGRGAVGGLQLGYNYQTGNIVWGIEGDISAAGLSKSISDNSFTNDLLASIRGRLGFAFDRVLVYGTGGAGYVHGKVFSSGLGTGSPTKYGEWKPVVGGGVEYAMTNNLLLRAEALGYLGSRSIGGEDSGGNKLRDTWVGRIGVSYKF